MQAPLKSVLNQFLPIFKNLKSNYFFSKILRFLLRLYSSSLYQILLANIQRPKLTTRRWLHYEFHSHSTQPAIQAVCYLQEDDLNNFYLVFSTNRNFSELQQHQIVNLTRQVQVNCTTLVSRQVQCFPMSSMASQDKQWLLNDQLYLSHLRRYSSFSLAEYLYQYQNIDQSFLFLNCIPCLVSYQVGCDTSLCSHPPYLSDFDGLASLSKLVTAFRQMYQSHDIHHGTE